MTAPQEEPFADLLKRPGWRRLTPEEVVEGLTGFALLAMQGAIVIEWTRARKEADLAAARAERRARYEAGAAARAAQHAEGRGNG